MFRFWGGEEKNCQGILHSGPLPCSSAFSGNTGSLAGVQRTCSEQRQVYGYGPLTKHRELEATKPNQCMLMQLHVKWTEWNWSRLLPLTPPPPFFFYFGFWLSVAWLAGYGDGLLWNQPIFIYIYIWRLSATFSPKEQNNKNRKKWN